MLLPTMQILFLNMQVPLLRTNIIFLKKTKNKKKIVQISQQHDNT